MKKRIRFTDKTDIRLGFEVECIIGGDHELDNNCNSIFSDYHYYGQFVKEIRKLKNYIEIDTDGSIKCDGRFDEETSVEFRTPPLKPKKAMKLLKAVFKIVDKYGYTNDSCGFHVNISSSQKNKMKSFDPIPFYSSKLWNEILETFDRNGNEFCQHETLKVNVSRVDIIANMFCENTDVMNEKYRCVNFSNWKGGCEDDSRIEIRGIGNEDYVKKYDQISSYIKRIEKLFKLSCNNNSPLEISV